MFSRTLTCWRSTGFWTLTLFAAAGCGDTPDGPAAGPPARIAVSAGNEQTGPAGELLPAPIAVLVTDQGGHGVPNVPVLFAVLTGGGEITPASSLTNGAGVALSSWRVGTAAPREREAGHRCDGASVFGRSTVSPLASRRSDSLFPLGSGGGRSVRLNGRRSHRCSL